MSTQYAYLTIGNTVFFSFAEEVWPFDYVRKRHHVCPVKSVILQGEVLDVQGNEFTAKLYDNNGFEKDGKIGVFNKGNLLCNQQFTDKKLLGVWSEPR